MKRQYKGLVCLMLINILSINTTTNNNYDIKSSTDQLVISMNEAGVKDIHEIQELIYDLGFEISEEAIIENLIIFDKDGLNKCWMAKINNKVVGLLAINIIKPFYKQGIFLRIDSIVVKKQYQGLGIGKQLLSFAEDYARSLHCNRIFLTSGNHRKTAHKIFKHVGFIENASYFVKNIEY